MVHSLCQTLRDSRPTYDDRGRCFAPKIELTKDAQDIIETNIRKLLVKTSRYLDHCGIKPHKPLWHYDRKNPETHESASEFKYGHLVKVTS